MNSAILSFCNWKFHVGSPKRSTLSNHYLKLPERALIPDSRHSQCCNCMYSFNIVLIFFHLSLFLYSSEKYKSMHWQKRHETFLREVCLQFQTYLKLIRTHVADILHSVTLFHILVHSVVLNYSLLHMQVYVNYLLYEHSIKWQVQWIKRDPKKSMSNIQKT